MVKKYFKKFKKPLAIFPDLTEMQTNSYKEFLAKDLAGVFKEVFPINDYTNKEFSLDFLDFSLGNPKYSEVFAKTHNLSYEAPLKIWIELTNKVKKTKKKEEIFLSDLPLMTKRGTFIVNGVERAVVAQISRSFGAYFMANSFKGKKFFGSKIIPLRGAWIEIETESDGVMNCRLDRKRKFPATMLLKIFGLKSADQIKESFSDLVNEEMSFIENTLRNDESSYEEAFIEVYKKLKPGEPVTFENAKELIEEMFFNPARYDLSVVGRYKLNQKLGFSLDNIEEQPRVLESNDIINIIKYISRMNCRIDAQVDDIDHLGNRRVRTVGEMLVEKLRVGMLRMKRNIQDKMSMLEAEDAVSAYQIINPRPFSAVVKEFFMTGQLSQFMNQQNMISELEHLRRLSALGPGGLTRERAGFEVRDVHPSHYGRICPIETPEGPNIGLVVHLSIFSRLNKLGILETPYRKVAGGKIIEEIVYLDAFEESKYNIAHGAINYDEDGNILEEAVEARVQGQPGIIAKQKVDFIDVVPYQAFSVATNLIPFLNHDNANRALMGSVMQRQAVPCVKNEIPLVATGLEEKVAVDVGRVIVAEEDGIITYSDAKKIIIKNENDEETIYELINFLRSNEYTLIHQRPIVNVGQKIKKGDILADGSSSNHGQLALGHNLLVAFLSIDGANFEDAVVISEKLLKNDYFSSIHITDHQIAVRDTKLGPEITTCDISNVSEEKLKNLDEEGIIRIGAEVKAGDILVGKISPKGEADLTPEERLLRSIFGEKARDVKDTSLRLPHGKEGRVIDIKIFSREKGDKLDTGVIKLIQIEIAEFRKVSVGDKLTGRHGNKGIVAKILKEEDMPYLEDGTPVDIVLNPLGVASRMNLGQILETHLGMAAKILGYQAIVPAFQGATEEEICDELEKAGWPRDGKITIYNGKTGEKLDQKVAVGYIYIMKLIHMVEDKIHMRSIGSYSLITQQPLGGKAQGGGQRFGEMEVWALEGYGAAHILQEMLTIKSDDVLGRASTYDAIVRGEKIQTPNLPASFNVLVNELKGLGLDVGLLDNGEEVQPKKILKTKQEISAEEKIISEKIYSAPKIKIKSGKQ